MISQTNKVMDFKERGITVGDLLLFSVFMISTLVIFNKIKNNNDKAYFQIAPIEIVINEKL